MLGYCYGMFKTNILAVERYPHLLCFSYKWAGEKKVHSVALPDFKKLYQQDRYDDYEVVKALHKLLDEADIVVGHNANGFDNKVSNARFLVHGLTPPSPYKSIDTLSVARSKARFSSNKLDLLGQQLSLGRKTKDTYATIWMDCLQGVEAAWKKMVKYCNQDVLLLEQLYYRLRPYITNHPNLATMSQLDWTCPRCLSDTINQRGYRYNNTTVAKRYRCMTCGAWFSERMADKDEFIKPQFVNFN